MHLLAAACEGDTETVRNILHNGTSPNWTDCGGHSALHGAAWYGRLEVLRLLLNAGANHSLQRQRDGSTPLHEAAFQGHTEAVKLLLAAGARPSAATTAGQTPLHLASRQGHVDAVRLLLQAGANPNKVTAGGLTPLHLASQKGHVRIMKLLLEAGASPRGMTVASQALMHLAAHKGQVEAVHLILAAGASPNSRTPSGQTPLILAAQQAHGGVVRALLEAGADASAADDNGDTALHALALAWPYQDNDSSAADAPDPANSAHRCTGVAQLLLDAGASTTARNARGQTSLCCAVEAGARPLQLLLDPRQGGSAGKKGRGAVHLLEPPRAAAAKQCLECGACHAPALDPPPGGLPQTHLPPSPSSPRGTLTSRHQRLLRRQQRRQQQQQVASGTGGVATVVGAQEEMARREAEALAAAEALIREEEAAKAEQAQQAVTSCSKTHRHLKGSSKRGRQRAQQAQQEFSEERPPLPLRPITSTLQPCTGMLLSKQRRLQGSQGEAEGAAQQPASKPSPARPHTPSRHGTPEQPTAGDRPSRMSPDAASPGCQGSDPGNQTPCSLESPPPASAPAPREPAPARQDQQDSEGLEEGDPEYLRTLLVQLGIGSGRGGGVAAAGGGSSPADGGGLTTVPSMASSMDALCDGASLPSASTAGAVTDTDAKATARNTPRVLPAPAGLPCHQFPGIPGACLWPAAAPGCGVKKGGAGGGGGDEDDCCVVCMEGAKDVVLLPCKHLALCAACAGGMFGQPAKQGACPMCRQEVKDYIQVYKS